MKPLCRFLWVALFLSSLALPSPAQENPPNVPSFEVLTEKIDITLLTFQPEVTVIPLRNTGKTRLETLKVGGVLTDGENRHSVKMDFEDIQLGLDPGQEKNVSLAPKLPPELLAGTYTGSLRLSVDNSPSKALATTLRTRGPVLRGKYFIPFLLFVLVLVVGCWVSFALDKWFGLGGLKRAQAVLSLRQIEKGSNRILKAIEDLEKLEPESVKHLKTLRIRVDTNLKEVEEKLANIGRLPLQELENEVNRLLLTYRQNDILWSRIEIVQKNWPPPGNSIFLDKMKKLIQVTPESDLDKYREALMRIIESTEGMPADAVSPISDYIAEVGNSERQVEINEEKVRAKIRLMDRILGITVLMAIFFGAYLTFYAAKFDFGTFVDYIAVFLWTLGLTQTGKKVLERATSSYTPKA